MSRTIELARILVLICITSPALAQELPVTPAGPVTPAVEPGRWDYSAAAHPAFVEAVRQEGKGNHKAAADRFREFIAAAPNHGDVPGATLRLANCLLALRQYDEAIETLSKFIASPPGTLREAEAHRAMAALLSSLPPYGFRREGTVRYNQEHREGELAYMASENQAQAVAEAETARDLLLAVLRAPEAMRGARPGEDLAATASAWDIALAGMLGAEGTLYDPWPPGTKIDPPKPGEVYDRDWPERRKALFLLDEAAALLLPAPLSPPPDRCDARAVEEMKAKAEAVRKTVNWNAWASARFRKALFLMTFPEAPPAEWVKKLAADQEAYQKKKGPDDPPFRAKPWDPGPALDPLAILSDLAAAVPDHPDADQFFAVRGRVLEAREDYLAAEEIYTSFLKQFTRSRFIPDVKQSLHNMRAPSFYISATTAWPTGKPIVFSVTSRNIKAMAFAAYKVDLEEVFIRSGRHRNPENSWRFFASFFGDTPAKARRWAGQRVASWEHDCRDLGDHRQTMLQATAPLKEPGAYLVFGRASGIEEVFLVVVSDITVVGRRNRAKMDYFVADAHTGTPVAGMTVTSREVYYESGRERRQVKVREAATDADGRVTVPLTAGNDIYSNQVEAFAHDGQRLAFTPEEYTGAWSSGNRVDQYKVFSYTDRPVYRPKDTVHFRHVVREYRGGQYLNVPGADCDVRVTNPKGQTIFDRTLKTGEFGTITGDLVIEEEAPLGVYNLTVVVKGALWATFQSSGSQFRVEEYKKPEFEVKVLPSAAEVRPGESVTADIAAQYYFGAPVAGAKVSYKVYRTVYFHEHHRPDRYDWLYGAGYGEIWKRPFQPGEEFVASGKGVTDGGGKFKITLPVAEKDAKYDYRYSVQAEVTDLSRRTINGTGQVMVTRDPFYLFLFTGQWFYGPGDAIDLEVNAVTSAGAPVRAKGVVELFRLTYPPAEKERADLIEQVKMDLDEAGRGFHRLKVKEPGQYRIVARGARDGGPEVKGERVVTVSAGEFPQERFRFSEVEVTTDRRTYPRGDPIRVMVTTPWQDATVWLAYMAGDEVLEDRVARMRDGSAIFTLTAAGGHVPNFFIRAIAVRDGAVQNADREVFVPPGEHVLDVTVTPDEPEHRPRTEGSFLVKALDHKGRPVRAEFSLAVFDASVLYIQGESAGDIRPYFYGDRRYLGVNDQHSGQVGFMAVNEDHNVYPDFLVKGLPAGWHHQWRGARNYWYFKGGGGGQVFGESGVLGTGERTKYADCLSEVAHSIPVGTPAAPGPAQEMRIAKLEARGDLAAARRLSASGEDMDGHGAAPAALREFFPDTALWEAHVVTDDKGEARVRIKYPDSLTTWAVRAVGADAGPKVGGGSSQVITKKRVTARLETPRFLTEGDSVTLAAVVRNDFATPIEVDLALQVDGEAVTILGRPGHRLKLAAGAESRVDFQASAVRPGTATITLKAMSKAESDAIAKKVPVVAWGSDKMVTRIVSLVDGGEKRFSFDVPEKRNPDLTRLTVVMDPSVGGVMLQALPYLIAYPHGCVEQTLNRFLPAAVVSRTLKDLGVKLEDLPGPDSHGTLAAPMSEDLAVMAWDQYPVRDSATLDRFVRAGIRKLWAFQKGSGGFGWWPEDRDADPYMTALVLAGLLEARDAGYEVDEGRIGSGFAYLARRFPKEKEPHSRAFMGYVLSLRGLLDAKALREVYEGRDGLNPYGKAMLALALWNAGDRERARQVTENMADGAWDDPENGTASFKHEPRYWWLWYEDRVESVAWALRAFMVTRPDDPLVDRFARWLLMNRQGNRWYSTKDTANAIFALARYMKLRGETRADFKATLAVAGKPVKTLAISPKNLLTESGVFVMEGAAIPSGPLDVTVGMEGKGRLYVSAFLEYFTREDRITGAGNEVFVKREVVRLKEVQRQRRTWHGTITVMEYDPVPLKDGERLASGDLMEVRLTVEAKNDYEYLVFEDPKAAGFEPTELKSGGVFQHGTWTNMELRDRRVVFFLGRLPQGTQVLSYRVRAEIPGIFRVLPARAHAMYAPRVRATSDSGVVAIGE